MSLNFRLAFVLAVMVAVVLVWQAAASGLLWLVPVPVAAAAPFYGILAASSARSPAARSAPLWDWP